MGRLPQTNTSVSRFLRQQKRVVTRLANSTPYALSGTSVAAEGVTVIGTPGGSRLELVDDGLRKYAADGVSVQVDLTGEVAAFSGLITGSEIIGGEFKTAASGARVEVVPVAAGGEVRFYTGLPDETSPGYLRGDNDGGFDSWLTLEAPAVFNQGRGLIKVRTGVEGEVSLHGDYVGINPDNNANYTLIGGQVLYTNIDTLEKTWFPQILMRRIMVVADVTARNALVAAYTAVPRNLVINSTHPLFIWKADEAAGAQLQYTVDGTTFATIGGGGGGTTLFADPNADRLVFWDDSAGAFSPLTASTGLTLTGTDLTVRSASDTETGIVELATSAETVTGTDDQRATTPAGVKAAIDGTGPAAPLAKQQLASLSIPTTTMTTIETWATFVTATGGMVGQASGVKVPVAGVYAVGGGLTWTGNATGRRIACPTVNGVLYAKLMNGIAATVATPTYASPAPGFVICAADDVISLGAYQDSGAALALTGAEIDVWQIA